MQMDHLWDFDGGWQRGFPYPSGTGDESARSLAPVSPASRQSGQVAPEKCLVGKQLNVIWIIGISLSIVKDSPGHFYAKRRATGVRQYGSAAKLGMK